MAIGCFDFGMDSPSISATGSGAANIAKTKRPLTYERPDDQNCLKPNIFAPSAAHVYTYNNTCTYTWPWPTCGMNDPFEITNLHKGMHARQVGILEMWGLSKMCAAAGKAGNPIECGAQPQGVLKYV